MKYRFLLMVAAVVVCAVCAHGDVVILKDGTTIEGTIVDENWRSLVVETPREKHRIEKSAIQLIRKPNQTIVPRSAIPPLQAPKQAVLPKERTTPASFADESVLKVSFDLEGDEAGLSQRSLGGVDSSTSTATSVGQGWEVSAEYTLYSRCAGIGGGVALQLPRQSALNGGNFYFAPLYLLAKLRTAPTARGFFLYTIGQGGYNFLMGDSRYKGEGGNLSGGLYYGWGIGAALGALRCEFLRTVSHGSLESAGYIYDNYTFTSYTHSRKIEYTKTTLSLIYAF